RTDREEDDLVGLLVKHTEDEIRSRFLGGTHTIKSLTPGSLMRGRRKLLLLAHDDRRRPANHHRDVLAPDFIQHPARNACPRLRIAVANRDAEDLELRTRQYERKGKRVID